MTTKLLMPIALFTVLGLPTTAFAHMIETDYLLPAPVAPGVKASQDRGTVKFTARFSSGEPFSNGKITVYAPGNEDTPWLETQTNEEGEYEFQPDQSQEGDWTINIGEGGHWDSWTVPVKAKGKSVTFGEISDASSQTPGVPPHLLVIGAACLSGGIGSVLLRARRQR
jgi:nickel transport protein